MKISALSRAPRPGRRPSRPGAATCCAARARERLNPAIARGLARAQADGCLGADIVPVARILTEFMVGSIAQYTRHVPDAWRRYLQIVIDGLRAHPGATPLATPAITIDDLDQAMLSWR